MYQPLPQENPDRIAENSKQALLANICKGTSIAIPNSEYKNLSVQLSWKNVTVKVEEIKKDHGKITKENKTILDNLSGTVHPGQFLAILGSTGAGKSTLLNFLSGNLSSPHLIAQGEVLINGIPRNTIDYSKFTAFFQQDDVFVECFTM
jgi:ABC-type multidrug transport system fused ATPase/permease subunit